jgi:sulfotransferase
MSFVALSGLPRTGSTLLSSILSQNPEVHAEGNSAVCQLMWDMQQSCKGAALEQLQANGRQADQDALVSSIPAIYYRDVKAMHIVDKCRSWTLPDNMAMMRRYITENPKVIVLTRPIDEIVESFIRLRKANGWDNPEVGLLDPMSEPIMRSQFGVEHAQKTNTGEFLFIEYKDLINNPGEIVEEIYTFCNWEPYQHSFTNIINKYPEDDSVYGLIGMHDIRPEIGVRL